MKVISDIFIKSRVPAELQICITIMLSVMLSACMGNSAPSKPTYYYTLDYQSPSVQLKHQLPTILRVERFAVTPPFDTQRIIYADKGTKRNSYAYHQWIAPPGELLPYFFVRDLRKANGFKAVLTPDASLSATHSLHGWVEEFVEKEGTSNCQAKAIIHISLINNLNSDPTQKIMLQKRYQATATCKEKTPAALSEAMSAVLAKISTDVTKDIHVRLSTAAALRY